MIIDENILVDTAYPIVNTLTKAGLWHNNTVIIYYRLQLG